MSEDPAIVLRERIARGEHARILLSDPTFDDVLEVIEADAIAAWKSAIGPHGLQTREASHAVMRGLESIRGQLRAWFDDGELAREALDTLTDTEQEE